MVDDGLAKRVFEDVLKNMGVKIERLVLPVGLRVGDKLEGFYVIPGSIITYQNEDGARKDARPNDSIYEISLRRVK